MEILITYKVLFIPAVAWFIAELIKMPISLIREKRWNSGQLFLGGMPSAHATLVTALTTTVGFQDGVASVTFAIALFFALVVMQDAAGVRQTVGHQSTMLNRIVEEIFKDKPEYQRRFRELIGHTRPQVIAGALLGIAVAWLLSLVLR